MAKTAEAAYALLDDLATNCYQWQSERSIMKKVAGMYEVDPIIALASQVLSLTNQITTLTTQGNDQRANSVMATFSVYPETKMVNEQVQYINSGNFNQRGNYSSNHYHPGLRNHENLLYGNNRNTLQPPTGFNNQHSEGKPSLEDILGTFISKTRSRFNKDESSRDTEINPKEHCKAITLRSGKEVGENMPTEETTTTFDKEEEQPNATQENQIKEPTLPFSQRFQKKKLDEQFAKFLDIFKKIRINIPFADALEQMPNYAKFMKDVMSKKRKLEEYQTMKWTKECSAILQKNPPQKRKDLGSFTIPYTTGDSSFDKALCDLGASINLMPLSVFKKLGLGEVKQIMVTLQLADQSLTYP
ncbi:uncharacterized protein LOC111398110 [Olea europaea var. sylvestris]|uniref:uncharacterized protein LOC111398110 n=1 Tax=Olea europaea var. sylvestris TaxID=158386 RepID=UPI000C1CFAEA|nr:uncharacterized protein LOC111398110 [Olea europaea var. sylvestris]